MIHLLRSFIRRIFVKGLKKSKEIYPDEIFLDSQNLPEFDTDQFEGRIEKPITKRTLSGFALALVAIALIFSGKLWLLQVEEGQAYAVRSENNNLKHTTIFANRGIIFDRTGKELAWNTLNSEGDFALRSYASISGIAHLLGYLKYPSKDKFGIYYDEKYAGMEGVESYFDEFLAGQNGLKITETDALGKIQSESTLRPPKDGENLTLSVDARINERLFELIRETVRSYEFKGGAGIILDVDTGEILAMVSFPEYDSNLMTEGKEREKIDELLSQKNKPFLNRVISGLYIPGSIVKPFIAVGVLEENLIDPEKKILSTGSISVPNPYDSTKKTVFKDWKAHGWVNLRQALAVSSNVYFFSVGGGYDDQLGLGISKIKQYMNLFGFGEQTGVDLDGEEEGNVPSPEWKFQTFGESEWRLGDTYNTSIGQYGFQMTPIQVARGMASLANDGFLVTPTVVRLSEGEKTEARQMPVKINNIEIVREGLRQGVQYGTALGLNMPGISVAAKTGTAELGFSKELVNSWSTGFFPYENPKYAFVVTMEQGPRSNQVGATYVMRQLFEWMYINTPEYVK